MITSVPRSIPRKDAENQPENSPAERERAALELLHAHRAQRGIAPRSVEDIADENARLLKADAERRAIQEGIAAWSDRRSKAGPAAVSCAASSRPVVEERDHLLRRRPVVS